MSWGHGSYSAATEVSPISIWSPEGLYAECRGWINGRLVELVGAAQLIARCGEVGGIDRRFGCDGGGQSRRRRQLQRHHELSFGVEKHQYHLRKWVVFYTLPVSGDVTALCKSGKGLTSAAIA